MKTSPARRSRSEISGSRAAAGIVAAGLLLLGGTTVTAADKIDVVVLTNGDRLTCEIKRLDRSVLSVSTDPLGKASIHWGAVAGLVSPRQFDVQLVSGAHYLGSLVASTPGRLRLALASGGSATLDLSELIRLAPIGASILSRVDGSVDAGFSFAQADLETHWTLNGSASYRSPRYQFMGTVASQVTVRENDDPLSRNSVSLSGNRSLANHWYTIVWSQVQGNQELDLDLRFVAGAGLGRDLVHTSRRLWSAYAGLTYNREQFSGEPADQSAEAAFAAQLDFFSPGSDDFKIVNSVVSYVGLTGRKRLRVELQSAWRHEFLKDFYWSLNGFDSFDGDPPADQKTNDFGVSVTLGWKF